MSKKIFISGATSAMAQAFARRHAPHKAEFFLLSRNSEALNTLKEDLLARGAAEVTTEAMDMASPQDFNATVEKVASQWGGIDIALIAQGVMRDQADLQQDSQLIRENYQVNLLSAVEIASALANHMEQRGQGTIVIISSVAGDRGRQSNYVYGSAKAALSTFSDGLRNRLCKKGVNVITVKPGFVDTPMTAELDKGGPLWATPEKIAEDMDNAIEKGKGVLYTPWFWRYILLIIQHIPDFIFKKLSL